MDQRRTGDLKTHIGFWMRLVSNNVSQSFARRLEDSDVTVAEWVILREMFIRAGTLSPGELCDLTGLSKGAISKLIGRLIEKQLVRRKEDSDDRRYQEIKLSARALALVPKLARLADENDEHFFAALSKAERKTLTDLLKKLVQHHQLKTLPTE